MTDAFVLGGVRTPVGRFGGSLSHVRTDDLLGQTMVAACQRVDVPLDRIEDITAGCVNVAHEGMGDIALDRPGPDTSPPWPPNFACVRSATGFSACASVPAKG
jgi:acetyl-CoA acetyltransferase